MDIIQKKPYEKFPKELDFSPSLVANETVVSYALTCVDTATGLDSSSAVISSSSMATPVVTVVVKAGTVGEKHHVQVLATTSFGNVYDKDFIMEIVEAVEGSFEKQPSDDFNIAAEYANKLIVGETISSRTVTAVKKSTGADATADVITGHGIDGSKVLIGVTAGADGEIYQIIARIVTSLSYQYQIDVLMVCRKQ